MKNVNSGEKWTKIIKFEFCILIFAICNIGFVFCPAEAGKFSQFLKGLNCYKGQEFCLSSHP